MISLSCLDWSIIFFFFQAEAGIRDDLVTGVQTCALPIYKLPTYDIKKVKENTLREPTWVHFGAGNIFRAFTANVLNEILNKGLYDKGIIVAETFDYDIIDQA